MQEKWSYNKVSGDFTKLENIGITQDAIIVKGNVLSLHSSILHETALKRQNSFETNSFVEFTGEATDIFCVNLWIKVKLNSFRDKIWTRRFIRVKRSYVSYLFFTSRLQKYCTTTLTLKLI